MQLTAGDLPLNFHPAAIRASANVAVRPNFGSPPGRVFRLSRYGGLAAPSRLSSIIGVIWPIAPWGRSSL